MKPRASFEDDGIPLADPSKEADSPPGEGGAPEPGGHDLAGPPGADSGAGLDEPPVDEPGAPAEDGGEEAPSGDHGAGAITGRYNSSPVGDIKMTKVKDAYNTYKLEMSMGQLEVIRSALEQNHADPVSDELLATLAFYMDKLPGPGEEEAEKTGKGKDLGMDGGEESPIPAPPGASAGPEDSLSLDDVKNLPDPPEPGKPARGGKPPTNPAREKFTHPEGAGARLGLPEPEESEAGDELPPPPRE